MGMFLRRGPAPHRTRLSDLEIGRSIKLNLNGTPWDWLIVHQGLPSSIYDTSCDGTWLLLKDIYEKRQWNNTNWNVLETSTVQSYLNGDFLNLFDGNIKGAIKQIKIPYRKNGGYDGTNQSGANGLFTKAFLLSGYEAGFTTRDSSYFPVDGAKLSYFESVDPFDNQRIAYLNGSAAAWWLRSPSTDDESRVMRVNYKGVSNDSLASNSNGIRPAIILPSDMIVTDDMLAA